MKKADVKIGQVYNVQVKDRVIPGAPVRIDRMHSDGGWRGTNLRTNRPVHIKSAERLQGRVVGSSSDVAEKQVEATATKEGVSKQASGGRGSGSDTEAAGKVGATSGGRAVKKKLNAAERKAMVKQRNEASANEPAQAKEEKNVGKADAGKTSDASEKTKFKPLSLIDAAAQVLASAKEPMNARQMVAEITKRGLWSPRNGGKTPHATLYSAILREQQNNSRKPARFKKVAGRPAGRCARHRRSVQTPTTRAPAPA